MNLGLPSLPANGIPFPAPGRILSTIINYFLPTDSEIWGVFDSNYNQVLMPDSFLDYGFNGSSTVAKFPVQSGSFADYNKVQHPDEVTIVMCKGGMNDNNRDAFIQSIEDMKQSTALFTVLTPYSYDINMNLHDYAYRHSVENGSHMVIVELRFQEIRQVTSTYSTVTTTANAQLPSAKPSVATGNAATVTPSAAFDLMASIKLELSNAMTTVKGGLK